MTSITPPYLQCYTNPLLLIQFTHQLFDFLSEKTHLRMNTHFTDINQLVLPTSNFLLNFPPLLLHLTPCPSSYLCWLFMSSTVPFRSRNCARSSSSVAAPCSFFTRASTEGEWDRRPALPWWREAPPDPEDDGGTLGLGGKDNFSGACGKPPWDIKNKSISIIFTLFIFHFRPFHRASVSVCVCVCVCVYNIVAP